MNNKETKIQLIGQCIELQKQRMELLKKAVNEAQQSANEYGQPKDRYDSYRMQLLKRKELLGHQLQIAENEYLALQKIDANKNFDKAEFGAVVMCSQQNFFISISIGKVSLHNINYYAISPNVPIYNAIKDLKVGNEFVFNKLKNKISAIF